MFISTELARWSQDNEVTLCFIEPGKPTQNAYVERLSGTFRRELRNSYLFETMDQVRERLAIWQSDYIEKRLHDALGGVPPIPFADAALRATA